MVSSTEMYACAVSSLLLWSNAENTIMMVSPASAQSNVLSLSAIEAIEQSPVVPPFTESGAICAKPFESR